MTSYIDSENPQIHFIPCDCSIGFPDDAIFEKEGIVHGILVRDDLINKLK
jgi:hypothetical protein